MKPQNTKTGIYYIVRFPGGWQLLTNVFKNADNPDHSEWWESTVAGKVAAKWAEHLGKNPAELESQIQLLTYAFPRGRVTANGRSRYILYGEDFTSSTDQLRCAIAEAFDIVRMHSWAFDEHEQCQELDKEEIRRILCIEEDWKAV